MRRLLGTLFLAAMCFASAARADDAPAANADVTFSSAGYYLETAKAMAFDVVVLLLGGPYSTEAGCKSAQAALPPDQQQHSSCHYEKQDPNKDQD